MNTGCNDKTTCNIQADVGAVRNGHDMTYLHALVNVVPLSQQDVCSKYYKAIGAIAGQFIPTKPASCHICCKHDGTLVLLEL